MAAAQAPFGVVLGPQAQVSCWNLAWRQGCVLEQLAPGRAEVRFANGSRKSWPDCIRLLPELHLDWLESLRRLAGVPPAQLVARLDALLGALDHRSQHQPLPPEELRQLQAFAAPQPSLQVMYEHWVLRLRGLDLDVRDCEGKWLAARIIDVRLIQAQQAPSPPPPPAPHPQPPTPPPLERLLQLGLIPEIWLRVHFVGWNSSFDEELRLAAGPCRLAPLGWFSTTAAARPRPRVPADHSDLVRKQVLAHNSGSALALEVLQWSPEPGLRRDWVSGHLLSWDGNQVRVAHALDAADDRPLQVRNWYHLALAELRLPAASMQALGLPEAVPAAASQRPSLKFRSPAHAEPPPAPAAAAAIPPIARPLSISRPPPLRAAAAAAEAKEDEYKMLMARDSEGRWHAAEVVERRDRPLRLRIRFTDRRPVTEELLDEANIRSRCRPPEFLSPPPSPALMSQIRGLRPLSVVWVCSPFVDDCPHVYPQLGPTQWTEPGPVEHQWIPAVVLQTVGEQVQVCVSSLSHPLSTSNPGDPDREFQRLAELWRATGGASDDESGTFMSLWYAPRLGEVGFQGLGSALWQQHNGQRALQLWRPALKDALQEWKATVATSPSVAGAAQTLAECRCCSDLRGRPLVGLQNLGNTCYLNAAVQCLASVPALLEYFVLHGQHLVDLHNKYDRAAAGDAAAPTTGYLTLALAGLLRELVTGPNRPVGRTPSVSPMALKEAVERASRQFVGADEEDSQEFVHFLLDQLNDELRLVPPKLPRAPESAADPQVVWKHFRSTYAGSPVLDLFFGMLESATTCQDCQRCSRVYEVFSHLSLEIPRTKGFLRWMLAAPPTLKGCLHQFVAPELLSGDNSYSCSGCGRKTLAKKALSLHRLPRALFIHLKRVTPAGAKITTRVEFPAELHLAEYLSPESADKATVRYSLHAMVFHIQNLDLKHFVAAAKTRWCDRHRFSLHQVPRPPPTGKPAAAAAAEMEQDTDCGCEWTLFDDSLTGHTTLPDLQRNSAGEVYLLLYLRTTV